MKDNEKEEDKLTTQKDDMGDLFKKSEKLIEMLTKREEERHGCGYYFFIIFIIFFIVPMLFLFLLIMLGVPLPL